MASKPKSRIVIGREGARKIEESPKRSRKAVLEATRADDGTYRITPRDRYVSRKDADAIERLDIAAAPARLFRDDGWASFLTGVNTSRDKRSSLWFDALVTNRAEQEELWRGNPFAAKAVEKIPEEMLREGFDVVIADASDERDTDETPDEGDDETRTDAFPPNAQGAAGSAPPVAGGALIPPPPPKVPKPIPDKGADTRELIEWLEERWKSLRGWQMYRDAMQFERAYGGGGIIVGADDGQKDMTKPLNEDAIKSVDWLNVLTPRELYVVRYYSDPFAAKYGEPEIYRVLPEMFGGPLALLGNWSGSAGGVERSAGTAAPSQGYPLGPVREVHESRVIPFEGITTSKLMRRLNAGWGDSIFNRIEHAIRNMDAGFDSASSLLADFSQAVLTVKGLMKMLASNKDLLEKRAELIDKMRSTVRMVMLDAEGEQFERKSTPMTGLPETLDRLMLIVAAVCDMPATVLFGREPAGLNATGESDTRGWYDKIAAQQTHRLEPKLSRLFRLLLRSANSPTKGKEPAKWSIEFRPLWQLDALQESQRRLNIAQADKLYVVDMGALTPEEVAASHFAGDKFNPEITVDFEGREEMAKVTDDANAAREKAIADAAKGAGANPPEGSAPPLGGPNDPSANKPTPTNSPGPSPTK